MSSNERFEKLEAAAREAVRGVAEIELDVVLRGEWLRLRAERRMPDGSSRYMELTYVLPDPGEVHSYDRYACRFGVHGHSDQAMNFDARQWGDLSHIALLLRAFMVDLVHESTIKPFVPPIHPDEG